MAGPVVGDLWEQSVRESHRVTRGIHQPAFRRVARELRRRVNLVVEVGSAPVRRGYYLRGFRLPEHLPTRIRLRLGLEDATALFSRRIEIGSGFDPTSGYIHVDSDRRARHVEYYSPGDHLPFEDEWAQEILAIHVLEHIHPSCLLSTLVEWRRVLAPGGRLRVHVPDSRAIMEAYLSSAGGVRWSLMGALLGMYANAEVRHPEELQKPSDHQVLFDRGLLVDVLTDAGFEDLRDLTAAQTDRHSVGWEALVPQISLIFEASKPRTLADHE